MRLKFVDMKREDLVSMYQEEDVRVALVMVFIE
jgi:hypothetical protein